MSVPSHRVVPDPEAQNEHENPSGDTEKDTGPYAGSNEDELELLSLEELDE